MIDLKQEKESKLTTQDIYNILVAAQQAATDDFLNSFIFERAALLYTAILLYPEKKEEYETLAAENVLSAYYKALQDDVLMDMEKQFPQEVALVQKRAGDWYEEDVEHLSSPRALLTAFDNFSGDIMQEVMQRFQDATSDENMQIIKDFQANWVR